MLYNCTVAHRPAAVSSLATKRPVSPLFPPCALALHLASLAPSRPYRAHGGMCSEAPCCLSPSLSTALPAAVAAAPCHRRLLKNAFAGFGAADSCHAPTLFPCRYLETYSNWLFLRATSLRAVPSASSGRSSSFSQHDGTQPQLQRVAWWTSHWPCAALTPYVNDGSRFYIYNRKYY